MNSTERREARYLRRRAKRDAKQQNREIVSGGFEVATSLAALVEASKRCETSVGWKRAVQGFCLNRVLNCARLHRRLNSGTYRPGRSKRFTISERGKTRNISAVPFEDRVVQRALCDEVLLNAVRPSLIYDNGASLKGKGVSFALSRLKKHLRQHCSKYGVNGGILLFDFTKFFENIDVSRLVTNFRKYVLDDRLRALTESYLYGEKKGLGLGNQTSQLGAILYANTIDHWIKDTCAIKGYGRYMDDGYVLFDDVNDMKQFAFEFERACTAVRLILNPKKFRMISLTDSFVFLKTRFQVTENGKVVTRICADGIKREKRKLRKMMVLHNSGILTLSAVATSYASWRGTLLRGDASRYLQWKMDNYFEDVVGKSWRQCLP